ncbi:MAG: ImmA/IrrE family metallo-endopeptidase [Bacteroidetes bacterium]|nr:MAG: ImmA/IrrE family metallo-endopeptidase [Bacteroidota bacterium]
MREQVGNRIKSARIMAGLSLRELSAKLEGIVSHTAIKKYEDGQLMPDGKTLLAFAKALNVKTGYFLRPQNIEISQLEFRKKSRLPKKKLHSIKESIMENIERYLELESYLNLPPQFYNPIENHTILTGDDVENAVEDLLDLWDLGTNPIPNVIELLEDKEIKVVELDTDEGFDGLSGFANEKIPVIVVNKSFLADRKRFTALHELGHLLLNFDPTLQPKQNEKLCHRFAGAMLLPRDAIFQELGIKRHNISLNELIYIKESYGISIQAIMARAKDLEIISNDQFVNFRIWVNKHEDHKMEKGFGEYGGNEISTRFNQLLFRATAEEIITMSKAASLANIKLASFRDQFMTI